MLLWLWHGPGPGADLWRWRYPDPNFPRFPLSPGGDRRRMAYRWGSSQITGLAEFIWSRAVPKMPHSGFLSTLDGGNLMNATIMRIIGRLLIVSMFVLPFQAQAAMIGTDQVASAGSAQMQRANLLNTVARPDVARQLQALGVDAATAKERVAAMTDAEVQSLANNINALPAGANSAGWGWAIVIALAIWAWYAYR